jgi:hypothetical protein
MRAPPQHGFLGALIVDGYAYLRYRDQAEGNSEFIFAAPFGGG